MHYNRLLIAIISLFVFSPVFAQTKLSKKQLMQERIQLMQTIDSLKQLIEAQTVEATQEVEEAENCSEINYAGNDNYAKTTKTVSIIVTDTNIATTLTSSDVIAKYHSGTRLYATLKDSEGNAISNEKVKFTVNGKKWELGTNANG